MNRTYSSPDNDIKIDYFSKVVTLNTDNLIKQIEEEMKDYKGKYFETETAQLEKEINNYYNKNIIEIDSELKIKLSRIKIEKKHEYLKIRDDLQNKLFKDLESQLIDFINSPDYINFLYKSCDRCINTFDTANQIVIYISANDKDNVRLIEQYISDKMNYTIEVDDTIKFGGLCYYDTTNNIVLNETIDERLQQEKQHFNQ